MYIENLELDEDFHEVSEPNQAKLHSPILRKEKNFQKDTHQCHEYDQEVILEYLSKTKDKNLYLFSEDKNIHMAKRFYAIDRQSIYLASKAKKYHLYEGIRENEQVKFVLDIDLKEKDIPKNADREKLFGELINECIELVTKELAKKGIVKQQIIILSSNRKEKLSAHVIFKDVIFKSIYAMKYFMMNIKSVLIDDKTIDMSIYKKGCFRMLWNSKHSVNVNLEFYKGINYEKPSDKQLFMDCLLKNIPQTHQLVDIDVPKNVKIAKKTPTKTVNIIGIAQTEREIIAVAILKLLLDLLAPWRADDYNAWIIIGICIFNCNHTEEGFKLWDEWSKKSANYGGRDLCAYKWNTFYFGSLSIASLRFFARQDNPEGYGKLEYVPEKLNFTPITCNLDYLMDKNAKIKDNKGIIEQQVNKWMSGDCKCLVIKSPYGTGKTKLIDNVIGEYELKRILFISYRQSLTQDLYGNFKKYGVESYLDGHYTADRIICQIESLSKLVFHGTMIDELQPYDLVIFDEIESILSHFRSSTVDQPERTFRILREIVGDAKKVLALDGDFGNRAYEFIQYIGSHVIIENQKRKNQKHFIFMNGKKDYDEKIEADLIARKNVVIVAMSSNMAIEYYEYYKDKYKSVLHCAKSDDKLKLELQNVNEYWCQFQLVIYSPTVEAGVNFDKEHFDRMYVVLSIQSCCDRSLMQMMARVRQLRDSDIYVLTNNLPFNETANFYTFDETNDYVLSLYKKHLETRMQYDPVKGRERLVYLYDIYTKILVHNETENYNKNPYYFIASLLKRMREKGHTYTYIRDKRTKNDKSSVTKEEIVKAQDIDVATYRDISNKQKRNEATRDEKVMVEKYYYKTIWKLNEVTMKFLDEYYGKTSMLYNIRYLLGIQKIGDEPAVGDVDYDYAKVSEKIKLVKEVVVKLGYVDVHDTKIIDKKTFDENIVKVMKECALFTDQKYACQLFNVLRYKHKKFESTKSFMGFINTIFKDWGFCIESISKIKSVKVTGHYKSTAEHFYKISKYDIMTYA